MNPAANAPRAQIPPSTLLPELPLSGETVPDVGLVSTPLAVALAVPDVAVPVLVLLGLPPSWITESRLQFVIIL